jgi:O-antigen/teichoic acid export membrane protein
VQLQGAGYAVSQGLITLLAALSTVVVARALSTGAFGTQSFVISFLTFAALFFDFGLFLPAARLTARSSGRARQQMVGAALLAFAPVGLLFFVTVFALSFFVDAWFHVHAGHVLRLISALSVVYPLGFIGNYLAQGVDRLHAYSITSAASQVLYLLGVIAAPLLHEKLTLSLVLEIRLLTLAATSIALMVWVAPRFGGALAKIRLLLHDAREYGFQVYIGRVLSMATYNMDVLMLGAMTDARTVGYYALAGSAAYVVGLPVHGLSAALFSRMTGSTRIDPRWLAFGWASGFACAVAVVVLSHPLIPWLMSKRYDGAIGLIPPLALAEVVRGVTTVYNTYLSAQGSGKPLRNAALILTLSNLAFNFALIPPFGALGAAWASLAALLVNLGAHMLFYWRSLASAQPAAAHG